MSLEDVLARWRPTVVVNAAALADVRTCENEPELAQSINVDAARDVARACAAQDIGLIHISTDAVFDGARGDYSEVDTPNPLSSYGVGKLDGETAVSAEFPSATTLRTNFFGWSPSGSRSIFEFFVNALSVGSSVSGYSDFIVTSLYVQHLAAITYEVGGINPAGALHAAYADRMSKYDFGCQVAATFGFDASLIRPVGGGLGPDGQSRSRDISLNTALLHTLLSRNLPNQADGIRAAYRDSALRSRLRTPLTGDSSASSP